MSVDTHASFSISCDHCPNKLRGEKGPDDIPSGLGPLIVLSSRNAIIREAKSKGWIVESFGGAITKCPECLQKKG